jgi:hypothetical protein
VTWVRRLEQLRSGCVNAEGLLNHGARDVGLEDLRATQGNGSATEGLVPKQAKIGSEDRRERKRRENDPDLVGGEKESGVLRSESVECDGGLFAHVQLEVQHCPGEQHHVALLQSGSVQDVVIADEARVDGALENQERLGCARVRVQRNDAANGEVQPGVRDALRVEPWPHLRTGQRCHSPCRSLASIRST